MTRNQNNDYNFKLEAWADEEFQNENAYMFNQFIQLRDTFQNSWKYYNGKAGSYLVVWEKEETIEVKWKNYWNATFNSSQTDIVVDSTWPYVRQDWTTLWAIINEDGRYTVTHKETVELAGTETRIHCYVQLTRDGNTNNIAVFDMAGTDLSFLTTFTAYGTIDVNLKKWDKLKLIFEDDGWNELTLKPNSNYLNIKNI